MQQCALTLDEVRSFQNILKLRENHFKTAFEVRFRKNELGFHHISDLPLFLHNLENHFLIFCTMVQNNRKFISNMSMIA